MQVSDRNREVRTTVALAIVCLVLQLALAPNLGIGNGRINFALVFAGCLALFPCAKHPVPVAFAAGILFDLSSTGPIGLMGFCLTLASFALGLVARGRGALDLSSSVPLFTATVLAVSIVYNLAMLLTGDSSSIVDSLFLRALPTTLLTVIAFLPFAYYLGRVRAAGSGFALSRRGSHLSGKGL